MAQTKSDIGGATRVQIDFEKLKNSIVAKYSLPTMAKIIGKGSNYFAPSSGRDTHGLRFDDLETICLVIGKDPSDFILLEEPDKEEVSALEDASKAKETTKNNDAILGQLITIDTSICRSISLTNKVYEGVEMNGAGIGKLIEAVNSNTEAINNLTKEVLKVGTTVSSWSQKWVNWRKFGRL